jgi:hypothetical protein
MILTIPDFAVPLAWMNGIGVIKYEYARLRILVWRILSGFSPGTKRLRVHADTRSLLVPVWRLLECRRNDSGIGDIAGAVEKLNGAAVCVGRSRGVQNTIASHDAAHAIIPDHPDAGSAAHPIYHAR